VGAEDKAALDQPLVAQDAKRLEPDGCRERIAPKVERASPA